MAMTDGRYVIYLETRPMLVAGRLRVHMEQRGYGMVKGPIGLGQTGFRMLLRPHGAGCWIHADDADAVPENLARILATELRCTATSIVTADDVCAYEITTAGNVTEALAARGDEVLEETASPLADPVRAGASLADLLVERGLDGHRLSFEEAVESIERRPLVLGFIARTREDAESIEIDPSLSCPHCGAAMRKAEGKYGEFFSCVTYPTCKGRLTLKQAEAQRD